MASSERSSAQLHFDVHGLYVVPIIFAFEFFGLHDYIVGLWAIKNTQSDLKQYSSNCMEEIYTNFQYTKALALTGKVL
jgi:hypothetical protein